LLQRKKALNFIQIGANDGKMADPIYDFVSRNHKHVKGLAVEPMKDVFQKLANNYKVYNEIIPINLAIHNIKKEMKLWRVDPEKEHLLPTWVKGVSSFDREHLVKKNLEKYMIAETVPCITLDELIDKYDCANVDLLQIDTEGYDSEIILNINFGKIKPQIIHFEHGFCHRHMDEQTLVKVRKYLHDNGYEIAFSTYDATAYLPEFIIRGD
jgi:FkbM family methyltransferase